TDQRVWTNPVLLQRLRDQDAGEHDADVRQLGAPLQPLIVQRDRVHVDERQERLTENATRYFLGLLEVVGEIWQIRAQLAEQASVVRSGIGKEKRRAAVGDGKLAERWNRERRRRCAALRNGCGALHCDTNGERAHVVREQ